MFDSWRSWQQRCDLLAAHCTMPTISCILYNATSWYQCPLQICMQLLPVTLDSLPFTIQAEAQGEPVPAPSGTKAIAPPREAPWSKPKQTAINQIESTIFNDSYQFLSIHQTILSNSELLKIPKTAVSESKLRLRSSSLMSTVTRRGPASLKHMIYSCSNKLEAAASAPIDVYQSVRSDNMWQHKLCIQMHQWWTCEAFLGSLLRGLCFVKSRHSKHHPTEAILPGLSTARFASLFASVFFAFFCSSHFLGAFLSWILDLYDCMIFPVKVESSPRSWSSV